MEENAIAIVYRMPGLTACPIETTFRFIGKKWTVLVLRELFLGVSHFNRLAENIEGITAKILSQRLKELRRLGLIERSITSESPIHVEYRLTELGRGLEPVLCSAAAFSIKAFPNVVFKNAMSGGLTDSLGSHGWNVAPVRGKASGPSRSPETGTATPRGTSSRPPRRGGLRATRGTPRERS